jgi:hypothetical protein
MNVLCVNMGDVLQCKKATHKWHIWFLPTYEPKHKKTTVPFFSQRTKDSTKMDRYTTTERMPACNINLAIIAAELLKLGFMHLIKFTAEYLALHKYSIPLYAIKRN